MKKVEAEQKAFEYFSKGFHCAEIMAKVLAEYFEHGDAEEISKYASTFGGGMGGTHEDVCGALSGALIFIGAKMGRVKPGKNIDDAMALAKKLREEFINHNSSTNCKEILDQFGPQENSLDCKIMVSKMAGIFAEIIQNENNSKNWSRYAVDSRN